MSPEEIIKNGAPLKVPFFMHITLKHNAQRIKHRDGIACGDDSVKD
jgi:hypothetical protein